MRSCSWIAGLVIVTFISVAAAGETAADGSVPYWSPVGKASEKDEDRSEYNGLVDKPRCTYDNYIFDTIRFERQGGPNPTFIANSFALTRKTCTSDYQCRDLDYFVQLPESEQTCIDPALHYNGQSDPLLPIRPYLTPELIGKAYTKYIQLGYTVHFKCENGYCIPDKAGLYDKENIEYKECQYGCLVTPITKKYSWENEPKTYSNFCVCLSGQVGKTYCNPSRGRHVYFTYKDWTCEKEEGRIAGYCGKGSKCKIVDERQDKWECQPLEGEEFRQFLEESGQYSLLIPGNLNQKITVAYIQNGKVIAEKPISNMSAEAYVARYGPIDASQAVSFAVSTGLAELVESILGNPFAVNRLAQFR